MSIEITYNNGKISVVNTLNKRYKPVILTELEKDAIDVVTDIMKKNNILHDSFALERRTDKYLTCVLCTNYDFIRLKITERTMWFSIDSWNTFDTTSNDERFDCIENRKIRHWKFKLNSINDLYNFEDLIVIAIKKTISK